MYTYKRAVGITLIEPKGQELLDISTIQTKDLFSLYRDLIIVVDDVFGQQEVAIEADYYQTDLMSFTGTIKEWLDTKASTPLVTSNDLPGGEYRYVTTHDIQYEWFSLLPGNVRLPDGKQSLLLADAAPDIRVQKTDLSVVNYQALVDRALWVINGHLVQAVKGTNEIYLLNGGKHFRAYKGIHVNCLNFNTVSRLKTYSIPLENINFQDKDTYNLLHVKSPVSLLNKTVWMVIGGRLYFDDVIQVISETEVAVRTERVDWFSRIFESKRFIDLSHVINQDREVVDGPFFNSADFFNKLLTDPSTSFLVVFDNPHLYAWTQAIETYRYPFTYHTEETRDIPLMTATGLLPKYFTRKIINRRLRDIDIGNQRDYLVETTGVNNGGNLYHGFTNRHHPSHLSQGYLLYIRGLIQKG